MKILDIIPYIPYPLNSGGNQAVFNMLSAMIEKNEVHILLRVKTNEDYDLTTQLQTALPDLRIHICDERASNQADKNANDNNANNEIRYTLTMRIFDFLRKSMTRKIERRKRKLIKKTMSAKSALQNENAINKTESPKDSHNVVVRHYTTLYNFAPEYPTQYLKSVFDTSREGFDVIQCEFYETLELVSLLPQTAKKVFVHHELRYIRNNNEMELFDQITPQDIFTFNRLKDVEFACLQHYDVVVTLTETDKELLLKERPNLNIYVSPAIVKYEDRPLDFTPLGKELVFVGSANHFPNYDGLIWYCTKVAPLLRTLGEEPQLHVTGLWQNEKRDLILRTGANVVFEGFVDDLHAYLNGKLSIVPIRIGSGMRMKILDAIDSASPIISTSKGCEGLDLQNGIDAYVCNTPQDFAQHIAKVLGNEQLQKSLAENSKKKLNKILTPNAQTETRLKLYSSL